ncbi:MAG TPA: glycosyltransferase family 2 protein [Vicinamibacterales bacterium]|nr:glycosyltransferase family 2 protein [Vicinamibacterales bacterium]
MIFVVLPSYNEEHGLARLLPAIDASLPHPHRVIVVDDGSIDRTAEIARAHGPEVKLIAHSVNQGLGPTLRDGLKAALASAADDDVVMTLDADNSHDPSLMPHMLARIAAGCDVVVASRFRPGAETRGVPPFRRLTSWGASMLLRTTLSIPGIRDFTCGFRAYRASALREALRRDAGRFEEVTGFECMLYLLLQLRSMRPALKFCEVPMILRYDRKRSVSRMRVWRTIRSTLATIIREI